MDLKVICCIFNYSTPQSPNYSSIQAPRFQKVHLKDIVSTRTQGTYNWPSPVKYWNSSQHLSWTVIEKTVSLKDRSDMKTKEQSKEITYKVIEIHNLGIFVKFYVRGWTS